jgi:hypothetical protein
MSCAEIAVADVMHYRSQITIKQFDFTGLHMLSLKLCDFKISHIFVMLRHLGIENQIYKMIDITVLSATAMTV